MSRATKATVTAIKALKPAHKRYESRVEGYRGLYVHVFPSGTRSFVYRYGQDGQMRRITLRASNLAEAAAEWASLRKRKSQAGEDISATQQQQRAEKQLKRLKERSDPTVAGLAIRYLEEHAKPKKRSWRQDEQRLSAYVLPQWGPVKANEINRQDVQALVAGLARRTPTLANRVLALVRKMFSFALDAGILDDHPCLRMKAPGKENARQRVLSESEVRGVWRLTDSASYEGELSAVARVVRLQLITGCRPGEILSAKWKEFDLEHALWTIPSTRSKNGLAHLLPLTPAALETLDRLDRCGEWLFPASRAKGPMRHDRLTKIVARMCAENQTVIPEPFTPHDLRRTVETGLARMGIGREIRDRVLNHKDRSVSGVHYNKHDYFNEKKLALDRWSNELKNTVDINPANVVTLRNRRKSS